MKYIKNDYQREVMYRGQRSYHFHHGVEPNEPIKPFRGWRIGVELEVEFRDKDERTDFADAASNWFYRESDGSIGSVDSYGIEIITIPLLPKDAKDEQFWEQLTDELQDKVNAWDTNGRCGLHIHIGREILGKTPEQQSETIGKLLYLYHHFVKETRLNVKVFGRDRGYNERDGKTPTGDAAKMLGSKVLRDKDIANRVKRDMIYKSEQTRYFDINLTNDHTIEFRKGRGTVNPKRIAGVIEYCELMCLYAKITPWQQIDYNDFVSYLIATVKSNFLRDIVCMYR